jgi:glycosyltransferase involved in cell wall biosynthesis
MKDIAVLVPALNCGSTIYQVVSGAQRYVADVIVVDDGSNDRTGEEARRAGAQVLSHNRQSGKGAALVTGMQALRQLGVRRALTMDGDGQHFAEEIPTLLRGSDACPGALIIGSRRLDTVPVAPARLFGNRFANRWVEIACGQRLPDTQSGFRVYPLAETLALGVRARHFGFETEVLIRAARARIPIVSVPVRVYYPPIEERTSHFRPFVDTIRIISVVLGLIFRLW